MTPVSRLLIRRARLVPIGPTAAPPQHPVDVLVQDGVVTTVAAQLDPRPGVEEYDADGRWLAPGLWDQHVHFTQWTLASQRLDLAPARSPEQALALVAERVRTLPGMPVVAWGHRPGAWQRDVTVSELDAVTGDTPVVLIAGDGHNAWLNTTALMQLAMPVRDSVVRETEWFSVYPRLVTLFGSDGTAPEAFRRGLDAAAARGVVGLVDFEFGGSRHDWADRWADDCDVLRVRWATYADTLDEVIDAGLRTGDPLPGCDERITMGPLKIISDGSLNTRTAWCCEPYSDAHRLEYPAGQPNLSGDELRDLLKQAHGGGLEVATHAIGDAAVAEALAAYAETGAIGSIEHAQLVGRDDVRRMAELGVRASVQPAHLLDDRDLTELAWPGRADRCSRSAGCSTTAWSSPSVRTRRSRRWTPGWRSRPPCTAAPTSATPGTASRRSPPPRPWPPPSTASPPSASGHPETWSSSTPTRWPSAPTRPSWAPRSATCPSP